MGKGGEKREESADDWRPSDSRAREPAPPVAERVRIIVGMMTATPPEPAWTVKSSIELAERWGLSVTAVRTASAEASRIVRGALGGREEIAQALVSRLDRIADIAEGQGDMKAATGAIMAQARLLGLDAPQKIAITKADGSDLTAWPEHLREVMATASVELLEWVLSHERYPTLAAVEAWKAAQAK